MSRDNQRQGQLALGNETSWKRLSKRCQKQCRQLLTELLVGIVVAERRKTEAGKDEREDYVVAS